LKSHFDFVKKSKKKKKKKEKKIEKKKDFLSNG